MYTTDVGKHPSSLPATSETPETLITAGSSKLKQGINFDILVVHNNHILCLQATPICVYEVSVIIVFGVQPGSFSLMLLGCPTL